MAAIIILTLNWLAWLPSSLAVKQTISNWNNVELEVKTSINFQVSLVLVSPPFPASWASFRVLLAIDLHTEFWWNLSACFHPKLLQRIETNLVLVNTLEHLLESPRDTVFKQLAILVDRKARFITLHYRMIALLCAWRFAAHCNFLP